MSNISYFNFKLLKDSFKMINPVLITLIGAIILTTAMTYLYFPPSSGVKPEPINFFKEPDSSQDPAGATSAALANAVLFVSITMIGGIIFVFFIKYGLSRFMDIILGLTMGISTFLFSILILPAILIPIFNYFNFLVPLLGSTQEKINENFFLLILAISSIIAVINLAGFVFDRLKNQYFHNTLMIIFGMSMGTIFGIFFEGISTFLVLIGLSLYDIYAVFRGPLKNMFDELDMQPELNKFSTDPQSDSSLKNKVTSQTTNIDSSQKLSSNTEVNLSIKVKNPQISNGFTLPVYATPHITIGLGDFVFFSVLIAKATYLALSGGFLLIPPIINGSILWSVIILPTIGILIGCYLTFVLLQKYEFLPALPLPLFIGILGFAIAMLLQF